MLHAQTKHVLTKVAGASLALSIACGGALAAAQSSEPLPDDVFAVVNGETVSTDEFSAFVIEYARRNYYHGADKKDPGELRAEAGQELIQLRLLAQEARRRGLSGDPEAVERQLASYGERYRGTRGEALLEEALPQLRERLLDSSRVAMLREQTGRVDDPDEGALAAYYRDNLALFTEPPRSRVSVILAGVEPWEGPDAWARAEEKARGLAAEIAAGADFAELARRHSSHESAPQGGDLGLVHEGTLAEQVQQELDTLAPGGTTPPVRVLEGYVLFRLQERLEPRVMALGDVRDRAVALYKRDEADKRWAGLVSGLRQEAEVTINDSLVVAGPD